MRPRVMAVQTSVGPIFSSIWSCGALHDGDEREHELGVGDRRGRASRSE